MGTVMTTVDVPAPPGSVTRPLARLLAGCLGLFVVPVLAGIQGIWNAPPSGALAAVLLVAGWVLVVRARHPTAAIAILAGCGAVAVWAGAHPAAGGPGDATAVVAGVLALLGVVAGSGRPGRPGWLGWPAAAGIVAWTVLLVAATPSAALTGKTAAFAGLLDGDARRALAEAPAAVAARPAAIHRPSGPCRPFSRSVHLGPFGPFDCRAVVGHDGQRHVVYWIWNGTRYEDHGSDTEESGLIYSPVLAPDVGVWAGYCLGHVYGDWYQFLKSGSAGAYEWQPGGRCPAALDYVPT
jgi:hypothetical protein